MDVIGFMEMARARRYAEPHEAESSGRTDSSSLHPRLRQCACIFLRTWSGLSAESRRPGPTDKRVRADVVDEVLQRAAAVSRGIFDLSTNLAEGFAFPAHITRREMPFRVARHASGLEVRRLVADRAAHRLEAETVRAARDGRLVQPAQIALARAVAGGMAVGAARMSQHLAEFSK